MTAIHHCFYGGYLVGGADWLPADPRDHYAATFGLFVGCNRLSCTQCGQPVRHALGYWSPPDIAPSVLYWERDWTTMAGAEPQPDATGRLYLCACHTYVARSPQFLAPPANAEPEDLPPWRCTGHPPLVTPTQFAGLALPDSPEWLALVTSHLGRTEPAVHPVVAALPGLTVNRVYWATPDAAKRDVLSWAVAALATHESDAVRAGVATFFALNPLAEGLASVLASWTEAPSRFDSPAPWGPEPTLRGLLLEAIATRLPSLRAGMLPPDPVPLATLRWAATHAPGLAAQVFRLGWVDLEWAQLHLPDLVAAAPHDWYRILMAIRVTHAHDLASACAIAVRGGAPAQDVLSLIETAYGPDTRGAIEGSLTG